MRGDPQNRRQQKTHPNYQAFLKRLYLLISCFTLLYFFVFTESYTDFLAVDADQFSEKQEIVGILEQTFFSEVAPAYRTEQLTADRIFTSRSLETKKLLPCGIPVGIYLETKGVLVTEVIEVTTKQGKKQIPCSGLLQAGDYILNANGKEIVSKEQFQSMIQTGNGASIRLTVEHDGQMKTITIQPVESASGEYLAGLWIRDNMHGIGTLTYLEEDGCFAALGHCINDIDTNTMLNMEQGKLYQAEIYSLLKGIQNQPGSLAGAIDYRTQSCIGTVKANTRQGIFGQGNLEIHNLIQKQIGTLKRRESFQEIWQKDAVKIACKDEIKNGKAQIINCFDGSYRQYEVQIRKIADEEAENENMNLEITVTDPGLLKRTGGILQGMGVIDNRDNTKKPGNTGFFSSYPKNDPIIGV